jgi:hypothetical protein
VRMVFVRGEALIALENLDSKQRGAIVAALLFLVSPSLCICVPLRQPSYDSSCVPLSHCPFSDRRGMASFTQICARRTSSAARIDLCH